MKKIPTVFVRDPETRLVTDEVAPGCLWVFRSEARPTRKWDGTCCLVRDGRLYKRRELKPGKSAPPDFEEVDCDRVTGKRFGWIPVGDGREDQWHREALQNHDGLPEDGTYELCGPKVQGGSEGFSRHVLIRHGEIDVDVPVGAALDFIRDFLDKTGIEGIVWHHADGRMAKIKGRDFGLSRQHEK